MLAYKKLCFYYRYVQILEKRALELEAVSIS